jgi:hypothetical protein
MEAEDRRQGVRRGRASKLIHNGGAPVTQGFDPGHTVWIKEKSQE